jgi:hypothetical protein
LAGLDLALWLRRIAICNAHRLFHIGDGFRVDGPYAAAGQLILSGRGAC